MGNKLLRLFLVAISSFAASVGLASCSVNNMFHRHKYNQQVVTDTYKVSNADCEHAGTYYYSCSCGKLGTETFEYGEPLGHNWHYEYFQTSEGEYYQIGTCFRCDEKEKRTIQSVNNLSFAVISEEEKTCEVIGYRKYYNDERDNYICIPKMWNDYKVTSIGDFAFELCSSLRSIVIPDSVTSIGKCAFECCSSLRSIVIPDSVTSIGNSAFWCCSSLSSIEIPDSVTSIGNYAFYYCRSLRSVTIGNSVTSIGDGAFLDCSSLSSIEIPDSVTSIGNFTFSSCTSLSSIIVKEGNTVYDSREDCNAIIETSTNTLITGCADTIIPDSVTSIGDSAFESCSSLNSIEIPDSVTSIGNYAFYYCRSLSSIEIPDGVTSIRESAFCWCTSLGSVTIGNGVTLIGSNAFLGCTSLRSVTIGNSVTSIGNSAFYGCRSLSSIVIPDSVTLIGDSAFSNCTSLSSIVISDSVTSICEFAFYGCKSLSDVYYIGSEEQWNAISIDKSNSELYSATIHYNYIGK